MVKWLICLGMISECMSGIALIGAVLIIGIMLVSLGIMPVQLSPQMTLLYLLVSCFIGVLTYQGLQE